MSPTQQRMLNLLKQKPRTLEELKACVEDDLASDANVRTHISRLRRCGFRVKCRNGVYELFKCYT